jgi:methyl-CpG-binding domain protein 4
MDTPKIKSPFGLIQEELRDQPWRLLVACVMLNLTSIRQVRPVIKLFFQKYPDAEACSMADLGELADMLKPLGLYNRRAATLVKLSIAFLKSWKDITDLPGVGKYAADSWKMFVEGRLDVEPSDSKLQKYLDWCRTLP